MNYFFAAPLRLAAGPDPSLPSRFSGIAYSGGLIPDRHVVIDLASARIAAPLPLLREHRAGSEIGVVEIARNDWRELVIEGRLFTDVDELAAEVARKAARGAPFGLSIGLYDAVPAAFAAGQSVRINGRDFAGPVTVLTGGAIREISVVSVAADPEAAVEVFNHAPSLSPARLFAARHTPQAAPRLDTAAAIAFVR